jgi:diadenosine tetraphosphate (Ap4A) HIT family hydrolase
VARAGDDGVATYFTACCGVMMLLKKQSSGRRNRTALWRVAPLGRVRTEDGISDAFLKDHHFPTTITGSGSRSPSTILSMFKYPCPFCFLAPERVVHRTEHLVVIRDAFPVSPGHTLLIPRRHVTSLFDLTVVEWVELGQLLAEARTALRSEFQPDGFNIGVNDGPAAGQIVAHLHVHLIPRYRGDHPDPRGGVRWILPEKAPYSP